MGGAKPCASRPDLHLVMPVAWETRQAFRVKAGLGRHLEKGSCTVCSVHCPVLETQPCPGPRMEPREGPHRRFLLCVSRETHLRPSPLLLGPRPWQAVGQHGSWGASALGAAITAQHLCVRRDRSPTPGPPLLGKARPQAGAQTNCCRGFQQELQASGCSGQASTRASDSNQKFHLTLGQPCPGRSGRQASGLARPASYSSGNGPQEPNTLEDSHETHVGVPHMWNPHTWVPHSAVSCGY